MNHYCDTSLLVAALVPEIASGRVHRWLETQAPGSLFVSDWTMTEFASTLSMKVRSGDLDLDQRAEVQLSWTRLRSASLTTLPVTTVEFAAAALFIDRAAGLRAGDALHLAIAAAHGCAIATLDRLQADAGPMCGVPAARV